MTKFIMYVQMGVHENMKPENLRRCPTVKAHTPSSAEKCWGGGGCGWGLQRGWKSKYSVSRRLLGHLQQWETERSWVRVALRGPSLSIMPGSCDTVVA